jgi:hypothetical protein
MKKYLVTSIGGYSLDVDTFFLNAGSETEIKNWTADQLGSEAEITVKDGRVFGKIPCDEHHMIRDTEIWVEPVDVIVTITL